MDTEPVSFHELDPANHRTVGRVDLTYLHSLTVTTGQDISLDLATARYSDDQGIRDEFQRMMESGTGKSSPFDHVVVWRLRYFAWNLDESIQARDRLAANGIQLLSVKGQSSRLRMSSTEIRMSRLAVGDVRTGGDPLEQIVMGGGHVVPPTALNGQ